SGASRRAIPDGWRCHVHRGVRIDGLVGRGDHSGNGRAAGDGAGWPVRRQAKRCGDGRPHEAGVFLMAGNSGKVAGGKGRKARIPNAARLVEPRRSADPYREMDLLRFSTAGSVDDGKSTLFGRLLYDTKAI